MSALLENRVLISVLIAWFFAQLIKTVLYWIMNRKLDLSRVFGSGGMPSSHSASVSALALSAALEYGLSSFAFAVSFVVAAIVVHDARGVRNEAGKHARILNEMLKDDGINPDLKEWIGHSFWQVVMGILLGVLTTFIFFGF